MPRNVRNFWIELDVDGKKTRVACGPKARDGGFHLTVFARDKGSIVRALDVSGKARTDGTLFVDADAGRDVSSSGAGISVRTVR